MFFVPRPFSSRMNTKRKGHVSFPNQGLFQPGAALQAALAKPNLTLAMAAVVAFPAPFLVHHRVTATLWTEITGDAQMTQAYRIRRRSDGACGTAGAVHSFLFLRAERRICCLLLGPLILKRLQVHFKRARHCIGQRTYLLHAEANRTAATDTA